MDVHNKSKLVLFALFGIIAFIAFQSFFRVVEASVEALMVYMLKTADAILWSGLLTMILYPLLFSIVIILVLNVKKGGNRFPVTWLIISIAAFLFFYVVSVLIAYFKRPLYSYLYDYENYTDMLSNTLLINKYNYLLQVLTVIVWSIILLRKVNRAEESKSASIDL